MAKTQIKPVSGGSYTDVTGKTTTGISNLPPAQQGIAVMAAGTFTNAKNQGNANLAAYAVKIAAAQGRLLQWV
jgi:hypothetical protein